MNNIAVVGVGYVGLVIGGLLAELGNTVTCIDKDAKKVDLLCRQVMPIYEQGLEELVVRNMRKGSLSFTTNQKDAFAHAEMIYIAVGTPTDNTNGMPNLTYLYEAIDSLIPYLHEDQIIVIKSTVPVGTAEEIEQRIKHRAAVVSNPEFLREGQAVYDAFHPDRIIIGATGEKNAKKVEKLYEKLQAPIIKTDRRSAELIKYVANSFLALKISFINEIANLTEALNGDVRAVSQGVGFDHRIGTGHFHPGIGYGGSCFPKDLCALLGIAKACNLNLFTVDAAVKANVFQREHFVEKIKKAFNGNLLGRRIAALGLAFKPFTDDIRESPAIAVVELLQQEGANVIAFDPVVLDVPIPITIAPSLETCVKEADAVVLLTEWPEFIDTDLHALLPDGTIVFDGRYVLLSDSRKKEHLINQYLFG